MRHHSLFGFKDLDCNPETQNFRGGKGGEERELAEDTRRDADAKKEMTRRKDKAKTKYRCCLVATIFFKAELLTILFADVLVTGF